jgi:hypothetical protein|tara:strand:+ start:1725 stop:2459 length:735 start_codon:yes stop_codon:yes gene_type:complete
VVTREELDKQVAKSLWIGDRLFPQHIISINSFIQNGFEYNLYVYDDVKNVPSGVILCDANEVIPKDEIWYYNDGFNKGSPSGFSNQFRFKILYEYGGLWTDTDMVLMKPYNFHDKKYTLISETNENGEVHPTTSLIFSGMKDDIWLEALHNIDYRNKDRVKHGETGPDLLTDLVNKHNLHDYVLEPNAFCSIGWYELTKLIDGTQLVDDVIGLHLFDAVNILYDMDKKDYPHDSILEQIKRKYL